MFHVRCLAIYTITWLYIPFSSIYNRVGYIYHFLVCVHLTNMHRNKVLQS